MSFTLSSQSKVIVKKRQNRNRKANEILIFLTILILYARANVIFCLSFSHEFQPFFCLFVVGGFRWTYFFFLMHIIRLILIFMK